MKIGEKIIGSGSPCYIIGEAGSNHEQSIELAFRLIDIAAAAKCDAVKFQSYSADTIVIKRSIKQTILPNTYHRWAKSQYELFKKYELPRSFLIEMAEYAAERKIHIFTSVFSEPEVDLALQAGFPAIKIASFELVHHQLIRYAAESGLPVIMSTGMAHIGEVHAAVDVARTHAKNDTQIALMHCSSAYPLGSRGVNLRAMDTLKSAFQLPVGYSDHTTELVVPVAAVARGAALYEKHFTYDRQANGPDHQNSVEPKELIQMVEHMRAAELALGTSEKRCQPEEEFALECGRRSLFISRDMCAGEVITSADISVLRPGVGLSPHLLETIIGRVLLVDVCEGDAVTWDQFTTKQ
jgi:sialic acid synthase SpsE